MSATPCLILLCLNSFGYFNFSSRSILKFINFLKALHYYSLSLSFIISENTIFLIQLHTLSLYFYFPFSTIFCYNDPYMCIFLSLSYKLFNLDSCRHQEHYKYSEIFLFVNLTFASTLNYWSNPIYVFSLNLCSRLDFLTLIPWSFKDMGSSLTYLDLYQLRLITDASRACSQVSVYLPCTRHIRYETPFCILHFSSSRNFIFGIYIGYKNGGLSLMPGLRRERTYFFQLILESISFTEWLCYHSSLPMKK